MSSPAWKKVVVESSTGGIDQTAAKATKLDTSTNGIVKTSNGDGTLSIGALVSGDIPNNAANTSGQADTAVVAQSATTIVIGNEGSDTSCFPLFSTGTSTPASAKTNANFTFNSSNGTLSATTLSGALAGSNITDDTITEAKLDIHNAAATDKVLGYTSNGLEWVDQTTGSTVSALAFSNGTLTLSQTSGGDETVSLDGRYARTGQSATFGDVNASSLVLGDVNGDGTVLNENGRTLFTFSDDGSRANVQVNGNLTVSGTTTSINTATLNVADNNITLNSDLTGTTMENAGITIERGDYDNVIFQFAEGTNQWNAQLPNHTTDSSATGVLTGIVGIFQTAATGTSGNADREKVGDMFINTNDNDLYIFI